MKPDELREIDCACLALRQAARIVTQFYGAELHGRLEIPQFGLLSVLERRPGSNQAALARALNLDKTTLSRNLKLMEKNGWIERASSDDRRERGYRLSAEGNKLLRVARPAWKRAQEKFRAAMGDRWDAMWSVLGDISDAAGSAGG
ncbi:MAG TPA: MarR family transcriptional regulator [Bryobacteraceae bacterium]|jgi:DNA-binding MarR family transcriptional regulator|nr:MarR family transcriptional regulator [Bryobacteraceae bacterium]